MRRLALLAALAAAALAAAAATASSTITAPPSTFTDPAGDSGTAPDLTNVAVTNDDHGLYTFTITFATTYGDAAGLQIFLDTDKNAGTGDPNSGGADYVFIDDHASHSFDLLSWGGSDWQEPASLTTASVVIGSDTKSIVLNVNKSELGNSTGFNFFVISTDGDGSDGHFDDAPSGSGSFAYGLQSVFTLSVGSSHATAAKAGGTWTVSMSAVRSDTNATVGSEASVTCSATMGSKHLAVASHAIVSSGGSSTAQCVFKVPKADKHKKLTATITVSDNGQTATQSFSATAK